MQAFKTIVVGGLVAASLMACARSEVPLFEINPSAALLSAEELQLASDASMFVLQSDSSFEPASFNLQNWPIQNDNERVGLRDVRISGLVVVIDTAKLPWSLLHTQKNIRSLRIEAEKIVVKNSLHLPATDLTVLVDEITFEPTAHIDVTPVAQIGHPSFVAGMKQGQDGAKGLPGSQIFVSAKKISRSGVSTEPLFIAQGGEGQKAGDGWGRREEDSSSPDFTNSAASLVQVPNEPAGVVFVNRHCSGRYKVLVKRSPRGADGPPDVTHYDIFNDQRGVQQWPENGKNAVMGGHPGAGGDGGRIVVLTDNTDISATDFIVNSGKPGKASGVWYGQKAGQPNPAFHKIVSAGCEEPRNGRGPQKVMMTRQDLLDGADAISPTVPLREAANGSLEVNTWERSPFSLVFQSLKLRYIKDLYFNRRFTDAARHLIDLEKRELTSSVRSEVQLLKSRLLSNKDYFGRGLRDAPTFAFEFDFDRYNAQVKNAMNSYYLARLFAKNFQEHKNQTELLTAALANIADDLNLSVEGLDLAQSKVSKFGFRLDSIKANQRSIEAELVVLNAEIEKRAQDNIESRRRQEKMKRFLGMAATICQVVPVGQPALGIGASLFQQMANGPKEPSLQGAYEYAKNIYGGIEQLNNTQVWENSQKNWKEFFDKTDIKNLKGKSLKEKGKYLKDLYTEFSPVVAKISEAIRPWKQAPVSASEIEAEIQKLQEADPMFQAVASQLRELVSAKASLEADLREFATMVQGLHSKIEAYVAVSAALSESGIKKGSGDYAELKSVFEMLAADQEHRILFLYDEAVRSYDYMTLSVLRRPMNIAGLRAKINQVLEAESDVAKAQQILNSFYDSQISVIRDALADQLTKANPMLMTFEGSNIVSLNESELRTLTLGHEVAVPLTPEFYAQKENVRITKIEVVENSYGFVEMQGIAGSRYPAIALSFTLGTTGAFNLRSEEAYVYPDTGVLFRWDHSFQLSGGTWYSQTNKPSGEFKGILTALVNTDRVLEYSSIFSAHAGITDLKIRVLNQQGPYRLDRLGLKVNYTYSVR